MNTSDVLQALQTSQLADSNLLTPDARAEVQRTLAGLAQRGLQAYIVLLPQNEEMKDWYKLWPLLKVQESNALLLLYNGRRWEARGWDLPADAIGHALQRAETALQHGLSTGLVSALTALATLAASRTSPAAPVTRTRRIQADEGLSQLPWWLGGGSVVFLGVLGWLLLRRRRLQQQQAHTFSATCEAAEAAFTQVMLADSTTDNQIRDLQLQATTHKQYLDTLLASVQQGQRLANDPVLLGEMTQMANQFATLHSAILRRQKEIHTCYKRR